MTTLIDKFEGVKQGELFMVDPDDWETGAPTILGKYENIREETEGENANLVYWNRENHKREVYKLNVEGNVLFLWSPESSGNKVIPTYKKISSMEFSKRRSYAELAYVGKEEVIKGFEEIFGSMGKYAEIIEKDGLVTDLRFYERFLNYFGLLPLPESDALKFTRKALKGKLI